MGLAWLMRLRRWLARPPSRVHVIALVVATVAGLLLVAIETWIGWPDWATVTRPRL